MNDAEALAIIRSPQFAAELWDFIAEAVDGAPEPGDHDFLLALSLVGRLRGLWIETAKILSGVTEAEAEAMYAQFVADQQALHARRHPFTVEVSQQAGLPCEISVAALAETTDREVPR